MLRSPQGERIILQIGFIGLGRMGLAMAINLLKAGHQITAWNRTPGRAAPLKKQGADVADSIADACHGEAVITMLSDDHAAESITLGRGNIRDSLPRAGIHISCSTISVACSDRLDAAHREAGQTYIAAPVLGRPEAAAGAKLSIIAAGDPGALTRCQPLFDAIGQRTFTVGDRPSVANLLKLNANFLLASMIECLGESIALIRKSGADPRHFVDIITNTLFAAPAYKTYGELIVNQQFEPAGFQMPLGLKDVRSVLAEADARAVPMPVASVVHDNFLSGIAQGWQNLDWSALARVVAARAGL
jgi:3-hydroxyisobutyrate dehydrogenase-like beta-hydroxyacid dehydrogenase